MPACAAPGAQRNLVAPATNGKNHALPGFRKASLHSRLVGDGAAGWHCPQPRDFGSASSGEPSPHQRWRPDLKGLPFSMQMVPACPGFSALEARYSARPAPHFIGCQLKKNCSRFLPCIENYRPHDELHRAAGFWRRASRINPLAKLPLSPSASRCASLE